MKLILLFGFFPDTLYREIQNKSLGGIQEAANALQRSIVDGLSLNYNNLEIINAPYIGSFPSFYKDPFFKGQTSCLESNAYCETISFCNILLYKRLSIYFAIKKSLLNRYKTKKEPIVILIYSLNEAFLNAALRLKKLNSNVKIYTIITDLPEFMSESKFFLYNYLKTKHSKYILNLLNQVDGYVLLTECMIKKNSSTSAHNNGRYI